MKKKVALLLIVTFFTALFSRMSERNVVSAATASHEKVISTLGFLDVDKAVSAGAEARITRAQFSQILYLLSDSSEVVSSAGSIYPDVRKTCWAASYIGYAASKGWMMAYLNGNFKPYQYVTLQEAVYGVLGVLGYESSDFSGGMSAKVMAYYTSKKLNTNITLGKNDALTRTACVELLYNTLLAATKEGSTYGDKFNCTLDSSGEINYLKLAASKMEGPIIMASSTLASIPINLSTATYMLNDTTVSKSSLRNNDILYYIETLNTVFAYRNKVTGTIESITLNSFYPDSVIIQGKTYSFESEDAAEEFSMYGDYQTGDMVTVLLGKDGQIAGVLDLDETQEEVIGVVTSYSRKASSQTYYSEDYVITVVDSTGAEQSYSYDGDADEFEEGDLVKVTVKANSITVSDYDGVTYQGTVSEDGTSFGSYKFAADVNIIDYYAGSYQKIYKTRLSGATIYESGVLHMKLNEDREIEQLILNNATGDLASYGMLFDLSMSATQITYTYDIAGKEGTITGLSGGGENIATGFLMKKNEITSFLDLESIQIADISYNKAVRENGSTLKMSDTCAYYLLEDDAYTYCTLDDLGDLDDYFLSAYYDKNENLGGRIRVIIARKKTV